MPSFYLPVNLELLAYKNKTQVALLQLERFLSTVFFFCFVVGPAKQDQLILEDYFATGLLLSRWFTPPLKGCFVKALET